MLLAAGGNGFSNDALPKPCSETELLTAISASEKELAGLRIHHPEKAPHVLMSLVMNRLRGRIDGAMVTSTLKRRPAEVRQ
jgi:Glu-tRNA(Gln) amidotransferase subunit E-like FAD-binding protein